MYVAIRQHLQQLLLSGVVESAALVPLPRVVIGAKEHVPPGDVTVVVLVSLILMVDTMHFRPLKEQPDPARRSNAGVVEDSLSAVHKA
jgi:hypothetical protein